MLKILFLRRRGEGFRGAPQAFHEFEQAMSKLAECKHAGLGWPLHRPSESVDETVRRVMPDADWVIDRERCEKHDPSRRYKIATYASDLHAFYLCKYRTPQEYLNHLNSIGVDAVFLRYKYVYGTNAPEDLFMKELNPKWFFLPWSVDPEWFKPKKPKRWDVTFIGSVHPRIYPLRQALWMGLPTFCANKKLTLLRRKPPTGKLFEEKVADLQRHQTYLVGKKYADAIGESKFFAFGNSRFRYPLLKCVEGASAGCIVFMDSPGAAKELGFIDGKTYVKINEQNWRNKMIYYLENPRQAKSIAEDARKLILNRHTHKIRARHFIDMLKEG